MAASLEHCQKRQDRRLQAGFPAALLIVAFLASPVHANPCSIDAEQGPMPLPRPEALPALPIDLVAPRPDADADFEAALDRAARGFTQRAPAWSLAVAGAEHGLWSTTIGADDGARFHAASIGKSMTAVLIFQQIEAGEFDLDTTVDRWFPDLPNAELVTIDHLLTHRSGYIVPADGPLSGPYRAPEEDFERLREIGAAFCPGTGWAYSNLAYQLLGRILERVTGRAYADLLQERILDPLDLSDTHVLIAGQPDPKLVPGHQAGEAVTGIDYATPYSAGPVTSTAEDLVRYWRGLLTGELLTSSSLERMIDPAWPMFDDSRMRYGAGLQVTEVPEGPGTMLMHSGGISGFAATVAWLAERELFVAVLVNEREVPAEAALWALVRALDEE